VRAGALPPGGAGCHAHGEKRMPRDSGQLPLTPCPFVHHAVADRSSPPGGRASKSKRLALLVGGTRAALAS